MATDADRVVALEKLLERTREKHKRELDRLHSQMRKKDRQILELSDEITRLEILIVPEPRR